MTQFCMSCFFTPLTPVPVLLGFGVQDWGGVDREENSEMKHLHFKKIVRDMIQLHSCHEYGSETCLKVIKTYKKLYLWRVLEF